MPESHRAAVRSVIAAAKQFGVTDVDAITDGVFEALNGLPDATLIGPPREHCGRTQCRLPHDWLRARSIVRCPGGARYPDPKRETPRDHVHP